MNMYQIISSLEVSLKDALKKIQALEAKIESLASNSNLDARVSAIEARIQRKKENKSND